MNRSGKLKVTILSAFRDAESYVGKYINRIIDFITLCGNKYDVNLLLGTGDSRDSTDSVLLVFKKLAHYVELVDVYHGGPSFGSIVHPVRFRQLAYVWNRLWRRIPEDSDIVVFMESDLDWSVLDLRVLLNHVVCGGFVAVAPMIIHRESNGNEIFRDTWAYVADGVHFQNGWPYHPNLVDKQNLRDGRFLKLESAGSLVVSLAPYVIGAEFTEVGLIKDICSTIYSRGGDLWLDTSTKVYHP